jgi:hypothetical protein
VDTKEGFNNAELFTSAAKAVKPRGEPINRHKDSKRAPLLPVEFNKDCRNVMRRYMQKEDSCNGDSVKDSVVSTLALGIEYEIVNRGTNIEVLPMKSITPSVRSFVVVFGRV